MDYGVRFLWYTPWQSSQPAAVFVPERYDASKVARMYQRAGGSRVQTWEVPGAAHTGGLRKHPADYERRTVGFLDSALKMQRLTLRQR